MELIYAFLLTGIAIGAILKKAPKKKGSIDTIKDVRWMKK
jgi:hypothetical protein